MSAVEKVTLSQKLALITEHWRPKLAADEETPVPFFEPAGTRNTGNVDDPSDTAPSVMRI